MKTRYLNRMFFLRIKVIVLFFTTTFILFGQTKKELDSIVKIGTMQIYENPDEAIRIGNKIVDIGVNIEYKIKGYKLISDAYSSKRDYEKSLEYVIKANQCLHLTKDELLKIVITNKTGIQYHQLKIYDKAILYLDEAEELMLNYPVKDSVMYYLGINHVVRGFVYKDKLNCEIAIVSFNRGINTLIESKSELAYSGISIAMYNKGNCYIMMNNYTLAKENFIEAIKYAKIVNASSLHAFALKGLAQVNTLEQQYASAITSLQEALIISKNVSDLILNKEIYKGLSENYLALNQWEKYKKYHLEYVNIQKLIKERERKSVSDSLNEKKKELDLKFEKELPNFYIGFTIVIVFVFLGIFLFVYLIKIKKREIELLKKRIKALQSSKSL